MIKQLFFTSIFTLGFSLLSAADFPVDQLDSFIQEVLKKEEIPGAAVALVQGDKILLIKGYGKRQLDREAPVNQDTLFLLASVSKTFTSAAVARLVDKQILGWDKEVIRDFPQFVLSDIYATRYTTPKDLLAHRTGLPAFTGDLLGKLGYSNEEVVQRAQYIPFKGSFREHAQYSNIGYFLAGELCAHASKKSFVDFVTEELFQQLEMNRTSFSSPITDPNHAKAYARIDGVIRMIPIDAPHAFPADGGVISTIKDIANWMQMFLNKGTFKGRTILSKESIEELFFPAITSKPSFSEAAPIQQSPYYAFSLGWDNYQYKAQRVIEKGGALDGVRTVITLLPDLNYGIAIFCNLNLCLFPEKVRAEFLELAVGRSDENIQAKIDEQSKVVSTLVSPPKPPEVVIPLTKPLESYVGKFENDLYGQFTIEEKGERLTLIAGPAAYEGTLVHYSNETFLLSWPLVDMGYQEITFTFDLKGEASQISTETLGTFKKVTQ